MKMKEGIKKTLSMALALSLMLAPYVLLIGSKPLQAAGPEFTLGAIPTVHQEVSFTTASTATVSTEAQFVAAYKNASINRIVLSTSITFSNASVTDMYNNHTLTRSLQIDGNGYTLTFGDFSTAGIFKVGSPATSRTLHFKNLVFKKTAGNNDRTIIQGGNVNWDIIFDTTKNHEGVNFNGIGYGNGGYDVKLFFRGNNGPFKYYEEFWDGAGDVVFESGSNVTLDKPQNDVYSVFYDTNTYNNKVYFAPNSTVNIKGANGYPIFYPYLGLDIYPGANVTLTKAADGEGVMDAYLVPGQQIRVDNNATLTMTNASGPAYYDWGNQASIIGNPGSSIELVGDSDNGGVYFTNANSKLILASPRYFNIQNAKKTKQAMNTTSTSTSGAFQFKDTDIAAWALNDNPAQAPLPPSPFNNVSLYANNGAPLTGSSTATLNTMPGGWATNKYQKITLSTRPSITASNQTVGVGKTVSINPVISPSSATVTYVSNNTGVATVSPTGVITGVAVGTTTIRITAINPEGVETFVDITVTVTNTPPVLTVPGFTHIVLGGTFDPTTGVSATDVEDGNLTGSIVRTGSVNTSVAGLYALDYSVTDSNGNTVTKKQVVLVNDGSYSVGNNFVIRATSFSKLISQVNTSDAAIKTDANIQVFSKATGALTSENVTFSSKGGYTNTVGVYTISMFVTSDPTTVRSITATVSAGNAPTIVAPTFTEIAVNASFNPMSGVSASDVEQGNMTGSIVVTGTVNTAVAGVYTITYRVTDNDGNVTTATHVVLVNDGQYSVGNDYILKASDFTKRISQVNTNTSAIIADASTVVYSKTTGLQVSMPIGVSATGGYTNVAGTYAIGLYVVADPLASRTIQATVLSGNAPVITAPAFTEVAVNGSFDPMATVTALDSEDGNLVSNIVVTNPVDLQVAGVYVVQYQVTDSDGNVATASQVVLVNDGTFTTGAQYILQAKDFTKRKSQVNTNAAAILSDSQVKVFSKTTGLEVSTPVQVTSTGGYVNTVGDYDITLQVSADLAATRTIVAHVVAGDAPVLTVPAFTEITLNQAFNPLNGVDATDNEDGSLNGQIQVSGAVDSTVSGVNIITYQVQDSDGNLETKSQIVLVNDGTYTVGSTYILHATDFTKRISEVDTTQAGIELASGSIIYSKLTGLPVDVDLVLDQTSGYQPVIGQYAITMHVEGDTQATRTFTATVISGQAPVLVVPTANEVALNATFDALAGVSATDAEDGNLFGSIVVTGTVDTTLAGVYVLTYSVTDSDGNAQTHTRVVLVNDGSYVIGDQYILTAKDFTKRVSEVDTADLAIMNASQTRVYDRTTGLQVAVPVTVNNIGNYRDEVGAYPIEIYVTSDLLAIQNIMATVLSGQAPSIVAPTFTTIPINQPFDVMDGVTAFDFEDGVVTANITVNGTVDVLTPGFNTVVYQVVDQDHNVTTLTRIVLVDDGTYVVGATRVIKASDFALRVGQVNTSDAAILAASHVHTYDKATGIEVNEPVVITSKGGYTASVGTYNIQFQASADSTATKDINAVVSKGDDPTLVVPAFREILVGQSFDPLDGVSAFDAQDGNLSAAILQYGGVDTTIAGVYSIDYTVIDTDGNLVTARQVVLVNDGTYVVGNQFIIRTINFSVRVGDVQATPSGVIPRAGVEVFEKATGDPTTQPLEITDYGNYQATIGTYNIEIGVVADPLAHKTTVATVVAGELPIITGPDFTEIDLNESFNAMDDMSVTDVETPSISLIVTGVVDTSTPGFYTLTYQATDSDSNTTTFKRVVLVNDGSYQVGNQYVIRALDFTKRISQVNTSDIALLVDGSVSVYRKATGEIMTLPVLVEKGSYAPIVGDYPIDYTVASDPQATKTINAHVISGNSPTITSPTFTEVPLNGSFNPMAGVSASDIEQGDLTSSMTHINTVNVNVAGFYTVYYQIIDVDGNVTTASQTVLVNDGSYVVGTTYVIQAHSFTKRVSQVDTTPVAIIQAANAKVFDKSTGLETVQTINVLDDGGYTNIVNTYPIQLGVDDATININGQVIAGNNPTLLAPSFAVVAINSSFDIMIGVVASDHEDGNLTPAVTSTGVLDTSTAGLYRIDYQVQDADGNLAQATQIILVNDGTYTVGNQYILKATGFEKRIGQVDTSTNAVLTASQVQVFDKTTGLVSLQPVVIDDLGGYQASVGTYSITLRVENETVSKIIQANVISGFAPVLLVPAFTEVAVNSSFDPTTNVSVSDVEDAGITYSHVSTVDINTPGVYVVNYTALDSDFNQTTASQVVLVNDGSYVVGLQYVIRGIDFTKRVSEVSPQQSAVLQASQTQVYSKATGLEVSGMAIALIGNYGPIVNDYPITLTVFGDILATKTITAHVVAGDLPQLNAPTFTQINVNDPFDPSSGVTAFDSEDLDLTNAISIHGQVDTSTAGVYVLTYEVMDSDHNVAEVTRVVLVDDGTYVVGTDFILQATDFTKRKSEVNVDTQVVLTQANAKVYNKLTGQLVDEPLNIVDLGGYQAAVGDYNIIIGLQNEPTLQKTIVAHVVKGISPTLVVPALVEVNLDGAYNPMDGVTATDTESGNLIGGVYTVGQVDTHKPGVYVMHYEVVDQDGNMAMADEVVVVNDGTYFVGDHYIIRGLDFTKRVGQVNTADASIISDAKVEVYDRTTGQAISQPITVTLIDPYQAQPGQYRIQLTITGDVTTTTTVIATVETGELPVITVPPFRPVDLNGTYDPTAGLIAQDQEDGDLTSQVVITHQVDTSVAGFYPVKFEVTDQDGNTVTKQQMVLINDGSYAVGLKHVIQAKDFTLRVSEVDVTQSAIQSRANVVVYDRDTGAVLDKPVVATDLGGYTNVVGVYSIRIQVLDDVFAARTILATVIDGEKPTIQSPAFTELTMNAPFDIMQGVHAEDLEDGDLTSKVTFTGQVDVSKAGIYVVTYQITDKDGNQATSTSIVLVNDGSFVVGGRYILQAHDYVISEDDVQDALIDINANAHPVVYDKATGQVVDEEIQVWSNGGYTNVAGKYTIAINLVNELSTVKDVLATVIEGQMPVIEVEAFTELSLNETFDPMSLVKATDAEDGDLTAQVIITGEVDVAKAGIYVLTYEVSDSQGNKAQARRVVLVNDGHYVVDGSYIITAHDFTIRFEDYKDDAKIKSLAKVAVYSKETGEQVLNPSLTIEKESITNKEKARFVTFKYNPQITVKATILYQDLPDTGQTSSLSIIGMALMFSGFGLMIVYKRNRKFES